MKVGAVFHFLSETDWLHLAVDAIGPFVSDIVIVAADASWKAGDYAPSNHRAYLRQIKARARIHIVGGKWPSQKEQRQGGLDICKNLGMDYVFTLDCDEIMDRALTEWAIREIHARKPGNISLSCNTYFKFPWYRIEPRESSALTVLTRLTPATRHLGVVALNGRPTDRVTSEEPRTFHDRPFHHFSWVRRSDEQIRKKISNHSCSFPRAWYEEKWVRWNPAMRNFHPIYPTEYARVARVSQSQLPPQALRWAAENGKIPR
jgi:hypothetical protein